MSESHGPQLDLCENDFGSEAEDISERNTIFGSIDRESIGREIERKKKLSKPIKSFLGTGPKISTLNPVEEIFNEESLREIDSLILNCENPEELEEIFQYISLIQDHKQRMRRLNQHAKIVANKIIERLDSLIMPYDTRNSDSKRQRPIGIVKNLKYYADKKGLLFLINNLKSEVTDKLSTDIPFSSYSTIIAVEFRRLVLARLALEIAEMTVGNKKDLLRSKVEEEIYSRGILTKDESEIVENAKKEMAKAAKRTNLQIELRTNERSALDEHFIRTHRELNEGVIEKNTSLVLQTMMGEIALSHEAPLFARVETFLKNWRCSNKEGLIDPMIGEIMRDDEVKNLLDFDEEENRKLLSEYFEYRNVDPINREFEESGIMLEIRPSPVEVNMMRSLNLCFIRIKRSDLKIPEITGAKFVDKNGAKGVHITNSQGEGCVDLYLNAIDNELYVSGCWTPIKDLMDPSEYRFLKNYILSTIIDNLSSKGEDIEDIFKLKEEPEVYKNPNKNVYNLDEQRERMRQRQLKAVDIHSDEKDEKENEANINLRYSFSKLTNINYSKAERILKRLGCEHHEKTNHAGFTRYVGGSKLNGFLTRTHGSKDLAPPVIINCLRSLEIPQEVFLAESWDILEEVMNDLNDSDIDNSADYLLEVTN